jgi:preprotein translocase subunit SecD
MLLRCLAVLALVGGAVGCGATHGAYTEFKWTAAPAAQGTLTQVDLDRAADIVRTRLSKLGAHGKVSVDDASHTITLRVYGAKDMEVLGTIIGETAELDFYDLVPALVSPSINSANQSAVPFTDLYNLLSAVQSRAGTPSGYVLFRPVTAKTYVKAAGPIAALRHDPTTGSPGLLDAYHGKTPALWKVLKVPGRTVLISCTKASAQICPGDASGAPRPGLTDWYLFKNGRYPGDPYATDGEFPNMTGGMLKLSSVRQDLDPNGQPIVLLSFSDAGNRAFLQVTRNEAVRGRSVALPSNCGDPCAFAIVLDNEVRSWPTIDPVQNPKGIDPSVTGAEINNIGSLADAKQLALILETGSLPVQLVLLSTRSGKD